MNRAAVATLAHMTGKPVLASCPSGLHFVSWHLLLCSRVPHMVLGAQRMRWGPAACRPLLRASFLCVREKRGFVLGLCLCVACFSAAL